MLKTHVLTYDERMNSFSIINPHNEAIIDEYQYDSILSIQPMIETLHQQFLTWKKTSANQRKTLIIEFAKFLSNNQNQIANLITTDMGKPITESMQEINKCIDCCNYYSDQIETIIKKQTYPSIKHEPLGIILGIMPWNFPLWQIIRFMIPTLIAGNTCLIKPAYNTYRVATFIQEFFNNNQYPITNICIPTNYDCEEIIKPNKLAGVSLTGSVDAGKHVGQIATAYLKPCVLELGGSDPYIIFNDASLETAIKTAVKARFLNCGQTCISAKRFYFHDSIYNEALQLFITETDHYIHYENPLNKTTTIGPMARKDLKNNLTKQFKNAAIPNKSIVYQNTSHPTSGFYYPATIIDGLTIQKNNLLLTEEIFGPIATCQPFSSLDDAIQNANQTQFGLGASVWSHSKETQQRCIQNIECGTIAINSMVTSNVNMPFGGRKQSGLGIELGFEGAFSFTGYKSIIQ